MSFKSGIINSDDQFIQNNRIKQRFAFTPHKQQQIEVLFGNTIEKITDSRLVTDNKYVAFVAIRWGCYN